MKAHQVVASNVRAALFETSVMTDQVEAALPDRWGRRRNYDEVNRQLSGRWGWVWPDLQAVASLTSWSVWHLMDGTDHEDSPATAKRWLRDTRVTPAARALEAGRLEAGISRRRLAYLWSGANHRAQCVDFASDIRDLERNVNPDPIVGSACYAELQEILAHDLRTTTVEELRDAIQAERDAALERRRQAERIRVIEEGRDLAAAIWTQANDADFIRLVIESTLRDDNSEMTYWAGRTCEFRARIALLRLADALRVNFPHRPEFALS